MTFIKNKSENHCAYCQCLEFHVFWTDLLLSQLPPSRCRLQRQAFQIRIFWNSGHPFQNKAFILVIILGIIVPQTKGPFLKEPNLLQVLGKSTLLWPQSYSFHGQCNFLSNLIINTKIGQAMCCFLLFAVVWCCSGDIQHHMSPRPGAFLQGFPCMARENLQQGHPLRITGHAKTPQDLKHSHEENNTSWPILASQEMRRIKESGKKPMHVPRNIGSNGNEVSNYRLTPSHGMVMVQFMTCLV